MLPDSNLLTLPLSILINRHHSGIHHATLASPTTRLPPSPFGDEILEPAGPLSPEAVRITLQEGHIHGNSGHLSHEL